MRRITLPGALLVVAATVASIVSLEADAATTASPQEQANTFLSLVAPGSWKGAAQTLLGDSGLARANPAMPAQLESQLQAMVHELGPSIGHELVSEKRLGDSLVRLVYVLKFERRPTVFELFFYRASENWEIVLLNIEADIGKLRGE